jgi:charged multivesicular body protein 6
VEFALVQKDVLFGLQQGTKVLQTINKEMGGIEGVERLMGETEDARAYQEVCPSFLSHVLVQDVGTRVMIGVRIC